MRTRTAVAQVPLHSGGQQEATNGILADERASFFSMGRDLGSFYALVEVSGEQAGRNIVAMQLATAMRDTYFDSKGSITSGLQQAIYKANKLLFDENRNTLPGEEWTAGVSCVALRGENLFISQAGPAAIFLTQEGDVVRYPDKSPWLDGVSMEEMDEAPLGTRQEVNVSLFHTRAFKGDTILLAETELARRIPANAWPSILASDSVIAARDTLIGAGRTSQLSALIIRLADEKQPAPVQAATTLPSKPKVAPVQAATASPSKPNVAPQPAGQLPAETPVPLLEQIRLGERLAPVGSAIAATIATIWAAVLALVKGMMPSRPDSQTIQEKPRAAVTEKRSKIKSSKPRRSPRPLSEVARKVFLGVAIAIPIIVAIVVIATYMQRGQTKRAELDRLWQAASTRWDQSQATSDEPAVRALLFETEAYLKQLLAAQPDHVQAADLWTRVQARLDEINRIRRINWVADLRVYPSDAKLARVVVEGIHVFVMDQRAGKVYHHQLDDYQQALRAETKDTVLVSKGDQIGGVLVNDLVDMTWMPAGTDRQKANLLILESGGSLIEYDPATGVRTPSPVADSGKWQYPTKVGSYYGRFYVLDPTSNQIWRYSPTADGYSAPPDEWLDAEVDLAGVVDMAIGNSIYLVYADGKIRKLTAGVPDSFDLSDSDMPLQNPGAIFTRPPEDTRWVYVADRGNSRIVQTSKEGRFERQFRLAGSFTEADQDPLSKTTSLFVDEISSHAYFLSGNTLYIAVLPD